MIHDDTLVGDDDLQRLAVAEVNVNDLVVRH